MTPEDLGRLRLPSDPALHPDGDRVAYVLTRPDLDDDRYHRQIWLADAEGARRLTTGPGDSQPRWSPDGTRLAFLRTGPEKQDPPQLAVLPTDGGEAEVVTSFDRGVEEAWWSPDGSRLVVTAVTYTEDWADLEDRERERRPRRITRHPFRFDNLGWLHDRRRHLWLIDPDGTEEPRCLTSGDHDERSPAWSPDGARIAFLSDRASEPWMQPGMEVWEVEIASGDLRRVAERGTWHAVSYRPDGALHLVGDPRPDFPRVSSLHRVEADGSLTDLTGHLDRSHTSLVAGPPQVRWQGELAYLGLEDSGRFGMVRVHPDGTVDQVVDGQRVVSGFDVAGGRVAFTASETTDPGEVWWTDGHSEERLTAHAPDDLELVAPEHFTVWSDDVELDVWVYLPPGDEPVPLLLNIHGGPASQYGFGFFDEFCVYAAAGFGVVATNPRGSSGKGEDFLRAVVGDGWGMVDRANIETVVDAALDRFPRLDGERRGVMGGSYGGFLTAWLTAHDDRWTSAVVERALLAFTSFAGTSDIGPTFPASYAGAELPDGWRELWEKSPLAVAHHTRTPTLVLHSENDFRCPMEQAEQYFLALLRAGVEAELLRFPSEGHEMSRSGSPRHRVERFEAILSWHRRHLDVSDGDAD